MYTIQKFEGDKGMWIDHDTLNVPRSQEMDARSYVIDLMLSTNRLYRLVDETGRILSPQVRLWVDDVRPCPENWLWAKTSEAAIWALQRFIVTEVSLDHDLGGDDTTRPVVLWMCENYFPGTCHVHSTNPVGAQWLKGMIERYK